MFSLRTWTSSIKTMDITFVLLVVVQLLARLAESKRVDIQRQVAQIVHHHNQERRSENLRAPYMMQLAWDARLAAEAQRWADRCEYRRPNRNEANTGSNLFYKLKYAQDRHSVHKMVSTAIRVWMRGKNEYRTDEPCRRSCDYAQMVYYQANQIGCAINTCSSIQVGSRREPMSTLLVCFYSPRIDYRNARPYPGLPTCDRCPRGTVCRQGLCSNPDSDPVPLYVPEPESAPTAAPRRRTFADSMSQSESQYVMSAHNRLRSQNRLDPLTWDPYLEKWARWIVRCDGDYPGPKHCYTNFERLQQDEQVSYIVYRWENEGEDTSIILSHGCRTPMDRVPCNHYTNLRQPQVTSVACASTACDDGTRQLVCLYDNRMDRPNGRVTVAPYRERPRVSEPYRARDKEAERREWERRNRQYRYNNSLDGRRRRYRERG